MSYFLGFLPDKESNYKIRKTLGEVSIIFDGFEIPVRWVKPHTYHITLYYLGERYPFYKQYLLKKKLTKIHFESINISLNSVKVGISRNYKELIYIDLKDGGEQLRELLLEVRKAIGGKDSTMFVPHLTIGRISKDLSKEEYRNISLDVLRLSKELKLEDIHFTVNCMYLIESKNGVYSFKTKFDASL